MAHPKNLPARRRAGRPGRAEPSPDPLPTLDEVCPVAERPTCAYRGRPMAPDWVVVFAGPGRPPSREEFALVPRVAADQLPEACAAWLETGAGCRAGAGEYRPELVHGRLLHPDGASAMWQGWNGCYSGYAGPAPRRAGEVPFCSEGCAAGYGLAAYHAAYPLAPRTSR
jgi:hypothetical protein